jgi:hypothetical protein
MFIMIRVKPDFFIVGAQRCGTTSLYRYLTQHPCVLATSRKEIHFFSDNYDKGTRWYRRHFPSLLKKCHRMLCCYGQVVTGEATPYYIFHPHVTERINKLFPHAKIVMMLRNPVDRAYSHYRYHVKLGAEDLIFEEAIEAEPDRLRGESTNFKVFSYLKRGIYIEQIVRWYELFPAEQILIIKSEDFFTDPEQYFIVTQDFLGIPRHHLKTYKTFNMGEQSTMSQDTRAQLTKYFAPYNKRLYEYLGRDFDWDR